MKIDRNRKKITKDNRSSVTNGNRIVVDGVDRRTARGRRWTDLYNSIIGDLGGESETTEGQRQLAKAAATLFIANEDMVANVSSGVGMDFDVLLRSINTLRRVLKELGLQLRAKEDKEIDLDTYLDAMAATERILENDDR